MSIDWARGERVLVLSCLVCSGFQATDVGEQRQLETLDLMMLYCACVVMGLAAAQSTPDQVPADVHEIVWPRPLRIAFCPGHGQGLPALSLAGPVVFDGPPALAATFERYQELLFRHGAPPPTRHNYTHTEGGRGNAGAGAGAVAGVGTVITVAHAMDPGAALVLGMNESYTLDIYTSPTTDTAAIAIAAPTQVGVLYALETLSQLVSFDPLHGDEGTYTVPCVSIGDAPRFPHRELMLDAASLK